MSITLALQQKEPAPAVEETDVEELREAVRHFIPVSNMALFPQFRAGFNVDSLAQFRSNFYPDPFAHVRSSMMDSFRVDPFAGIRNSMMDSFRVDPFAAESIRNSVRDSNMYSVAEAVRNSFAVNHDMNSLARTAEEIRKSFNANPLSGFRDRP